MSMPGWGRRLLDPHTVENAVVTSLAAGALTLIPPAALTPAGRFGYRAATAAMAAGGVAMELHVNDAGDELDAVTRVALPVAAAGLILGLADPSEWLDSRLDHSLRNRNVRHPRLVMGAVATGFSLAAYALGRAAELRFAAEAPPVEARLEPISAELRELVLGILAAREGYGSKELRAQLDRAQVRRWPDVADVSTLTAFSVPPDVELAVPHDCTFPVKALFVTATGCRGQVSLIVADGLLDALVLDPLGDDGPDLAGRDLDGLERWPTIGEVTFVHDSAGR